MIEMPPHSATLASQQVTQGLARARLVGWAMYLSYAAIVAQVVILVWVLRVLDRLGSVSLTPGSMSVSSARTAQGVLDELNGPVSSATTAVTLFAFGAVLVTGVATLRWAGLARIIAESSGAVRMRYGSAARVLCWLIPVWCWFGPKQVVNDLWTASDPQAGPRVDVMESTPPRWLLAWWVPWIATPLLIASGSRLVGTSLAALRVFEYLVIVALLLSAGAGVVFVRIVRTISQRQIARAANLGFLAR